MRCLYVAGQLFWVESDLLLPAPDLWLELDLGRIACYWQSIEQVANRQALNLRSADWLERPDWSAHAAALSLANWHASHRFCVACAAQTRFETAQSRRCGGCQRQHYPRTDPAVLVRVSFEDRLLLVNQPPWPSELFSLISGFVSPGETAEACAVREVQEEVGLSVQVGAYLGSQPWPFPGNLMLAFAAQANSESVQIDGVEIAQARWFSAAQLRAELALGQIRLPSPISLSRRIIDDWLANFPS